ncbi:MAG: type II toxin-antitoxin system VapB family antitoxin [Bacteroidota bacterium]
MRTTLNLPDDLVRETQALYNADNRSNAVENALKDAIRFKKLQMLMALKGRIDFDAASIEKLREAEAGEREAPR